MTAIRIQHTGMKARDRDVTLATKNLILGPVGSGKSTILDAIRFIGCGHVPHLGKSERATEAILRESMMEAQIELADGRVIRRSLERGGKGALSRDAQASWAPDARPTEAGKEISALFGASDLEAAENLDLRALLAASPNERAARIEALVGASSRPVEDQVRRLGALTLLRAAHVAIDRIPDDVEASVGVADGVRPLIPATVRAVIDDVIGSVAAPLRSADLRAAAKIAREARLGAAAASRQKVSARAELEDRIASLGQGPDALEDLVARRDAAAAEQAAALRDIETSGAAAEQRAAAESALPALRAALEEAATALEDARAALIDAETQRQAAAAIVDPPEVPAFEPVAPDAGQLAEAARRHEEATEFAQQADAVVIPAPIDLTAVRAAEAAAEAALQRALKGPWQEVRELADALDELMAVAAAHSATTDIAHRLLDLADEHGGDPVVLGARHEAAIRATAEAEAAAAERASEQQDARERLTALRAEEQADRTLAAQILQEAEGAARDATRQARAIHDAARAARARAVAQNQTHRTEHLDAATRIERRAIDAQTTHDRAASALREVLARLAGMAEVTADPIAARAAIERATAVIDDLDGRIHVLRQIAARRQEMASLVEEIDRATAIERGYRDAEWACQRLREEDLDARAGGLVGRTRTFLRGAGRDEDPYIRSLAAKCEFGWRRTDGREVAVEALSGGESVIYCAALAAAVIAERAPQVRALLIEGAELGSSEPAAAIMRGCDAVADDLDLICVATNAPIEALEGWQVIECGAAVALGEEDA